MTAKVITPHEEVVISEAIGLEVDHGVLYVLGDTGRTNSVFASGSWDYAALVDEEDPPVPPEPRVWENADEIPDGVVVSDNEGIYWKWEDGRRYLGGKGSRTWDKGVPLEGNNSNAWLHRYRPFTEVLEGTDD